MLRCRSILAPQGQHASDMTEGDPPTDTDAAMYRCILDNALDLIVRVDTAHNRTYVSPSSREVLGYEPEELLHGNAYALIHPEDRAMVRAVTGQITAALPCLNLVFRMRRKDGNYIWVEGRYRSLPMDGGALAVLRDITAQKQAEDALAEANHRLEAANLALRQHAHQDGLTGLANRRRFDEVLDMEFRRARRHELPLGLVLLDVDHFKLYNDSYGHIAGDTCLCRIGAAIAGAACRPGDLIARYGGEEIVALLPWTDLNGTAALADRMREAVASLAIEHRRSPYGVATVSAGATALLPVGPGREPVDLVIAADQALYQAKRDGRNRVCMTGISMGARGSVAPQPPDIPAGADRSAA